MRILGGSLPWSDWWCKVCLKSYPTEGWNETCPLPWFWRHLGSFVFWPGEKKSKITFFACLYHNPTFCWVPSWTFVDFVSKGLEKNFLYFSRLGLTENVFPFSEDLDKTSSRPEPNNKDPLKSNPDSLALVVSLPSQAFTHMALLAKLISAPVFAEALTESTAASARNSTAFPITERGSRISWDLFSLGKVSTKPLYPEVCISGNAGCC